MAAGEQRLASFIGGPEAVFMGVDLSLETHKHTRQLEDTGNNACVFVASVLIPYRFLTH